MAFAKMGAGFGRMLNPLGRAAVTPGTPITVPTAGGGFSGSAPAGVTLRRQASEQITHNFDPTSLIPTIDVQYYVDPINGSDGNSGLTSGLPLLNLATAVAKNPAGTTIGVEIINLVADFIARGAAGWNNTIPTKGVVVRNRTGFRFQNVKAGNSPEVYTVDGTFSNVYSTVIALPLSVADLKNKSQPTIVIPSGKKVTVDGVYVTGDGVTATTINNAPPVYQILAKVGSLAAVNATAGTWFHDGTNLKIRPYDDRDLTVAGNAATIIPTITGNSGRPCGVNNSVTYVEGIDFVGGVTPFIISNASTVTGRKIVFNSVSFQAAGTGANGLSITAFATIYSYRCGAHYNSADGYNYHSFENDAGVTTGTSPTYYEFECVAKGNGTTGSAGTSDNTSTCHDWCVGTRVNGLYLDSDDGPCVETNFANVWMLGCFVGASIKGTAGTENSQAIISAKKWMDNNVLAVGAASQVSVNSTAFLGYTHWQGAAPSQAGSGTLTAY